MTPVVDPFMAGVKPTGLQKGRGGFLRSADDAPYVSDPSGALVQSGERKGLVKRLKYGSPSNRGREIENDAGLVKYKQRLTLVGIGMDPSLADACRDLAMMAVGSPEFNSAADAIAVAADKLTRSSLAADRGTHGHLLCELFDRDVQVDACDYLEAGRVLGLDAKTQADVIFAWQRLLRDNGLEVLAIEASCVDDKWRLAGTLDRIVRTTRDLTFAKSTGEIVTIPANTVLVLDIKFGRCRLAHPIQIASYAQSVPYDTETEVRGEWPFTIDQTHALIAHGDFGDDTRPVTIELVWVDLAAGRDHGGETVVQAKAWAARDDVFSVAQLPVDVEGEGSAIAPVIPAPSTPLADAPVKAATRECSTCGGTQTVTVGDGDYEGAGCHEEHCPDCNSTPLADAPDLTASASTGEAACGKPPSPVIFEGLMTQGLLVQTNTSAVSVTGQTERLALVDARASLATSPAQGADLTDAEFAPLWDAVRAEYQALDAAARSWATELSSKATRQGLSFHTARVRTERSYYIVRALVSLCQAGCDRDEVLRALLALIVGDVAVFPGVHAGHVLGSLHSAEAERLALLVDAFSADRLIADVDNDGVYRLRERAA